ncbi:MAG TPA: hypothetical protein PLM24_02565 [Methanothrix sp.]|nr:hypothetical protein [Methanothrix sp.]HPJ84785.1 hypothetical protein [Methanothrix sp.]HPR66001.1 hypothetical protein [Methanothrix sp.]
MISRSFILVCLILLFATAIAGAEDEGYLNVVGPSGTIAGANYSEYGSAFEEFMGRASAERNLSSYPDYLVEFLDEGPERTATNYSLYSPAFEIFMNQSRGRRVNLSPYPDYLSRFLNQSSENLSSRSWNLSSYPDYLSWFLNR